MNRNSEVIKVSSKELFWTIVRKIPRLRVFTNLLDECLSIDLIGKSSLSQLDEGFEFTCTV